MAEPLYEQLYKHVLSQIEQGRLRPGDRVPSEKELAASFQVSRITSKKALEKLAQEGVIERVRGRGSFVARPTGFGDGEVGIAENAALRPEHRPKSFVGFLVPDISDVFGTHMMRTIERALRAQGIRLLVCRTEGSQEKEEAAIDDFLRLGTRGLIVLPVYGEYYNEHLLRLVLNRFPVTLVDRYLRGIPACSICSDNRQGAENLTNHLIGLGHRHIAFVSPPASGTSSIEDRMLGMMGAMAGRGLPFTTDDHVVYAYCTLPGAFTPFTEHVERDEEAVRAYVLRHPEVTAFVACEYPLALLIQRVLEQLGRSVPQDYSIACFDSNHTSLETPRITHCKQDEESMGLKAVELLLAQIEGAEVPLHVVIESDLVIGMSTAPVRIAEGFGDDMPFPPGMI